MCHGGQRRDTFNFSDHFTRSERLHRGPDGVTTGGGSSAAETPLKNELRDNPQNAAAAFAPSSNAGSEGGDSIASRIARSSSRTAPRGSATGASVGIATPGVLGLDFVGQPRDGRSDTVDALRESE
jgi:hypothetical protein